MKTKNFIYAAFAGIILASCSSNDFAGDQNLLENSGGGGAISFGFDVPTPTRASGADAATKLNSQFIVWGEKNESGKDAPTEGNLVIKNYVVNYVTNSAYTSTSNTKDWEYVGFKFNDNSATIPTTSYFTNITPNSGSGVEQTIKYWDYAASNYVFTAVSALPADITNGRVVINKLTSDDDSKYEKGYTITLAKTGTSPDFVYPSLANLYFSDRNEITQGTGNDRTAPNAYGGNVMFTFRNALSQVRAGVYETIPGYAVTAIKFYVTGDAEAKVSATSAFGVIAKNTNPATYEGTLTVTYYDATDDDTKNHPKLSFSGTPANDLILGTNMSTLSTSNTLGTTSASPTWDTDGGTFTLVLPQIGNTTNMKLKVDYTLYNSVTGETINITGKTAEVPAQYLQWKPNFKYTYLFKITDDDLYPITFDGVIVEAEDGTAEYITTVTEPSITTFGVKDSKYVTGGSEYAAGSDIYATIMDASSVADFTFNSQAAGGVNVYLATTTDADKFPITEASVAESLAEISTGTKKITYVLKNDDGTTSFTAVPDEVTTVPGEDGVDITGTHALKLTGAKATTATTALVVEYIKTPATYHTTEHTYASAEAVTAAISGGLTLYKDITGTTLASSSDWTSESTKFYSRDAVLSVGEYAYKVIKVVAAP